MKKRNHDRGFILVLSMLLLLVLTTMGLFSLRATRTELKMVQNISDKVMAEYVAEAGMIHVLDAISRNPESTVLGYKMYSRQSTLGLDGGVARYSFGHDPTLFGESSPSFDALGLGVAIKPEISVEVSAAMDASTSAVPGYSVSAHTPTVKVKRMVLTATGIIREARDGGVELGKARVRVWILVPYK